MVESGDSRSVADLLITELEIAGSSKPDDADSNSQSTVLIKIHAEPGDDWQPQLENQDATNQEILKSLYKTGTAAFYLDYSDSDNGVVDSLGKIIGSKIRRLTIDEKRGPVGWSVVDKLIDGMQFDQLKIAPNCFTNETAAKVMEIVVEHEVDHVSLIVREVATTDPEPFLTLLSTSVRSLYISQKNIKDLEKKSTHFFGKVDFDWAPLFAEMLAGKLEKLKIDSFFHSYLSPDSSRSLIKLLPSLEKKIWFESDSAPSGMAFQFMRDGYCVTVTRSTNPCMLRIRHPSMRGEVMEM